MGNSVGGAQSPQGDPALPEPPGLSTVSLSYCIPWHCCNRVSEAISYSMRNVGALTDAVGKTYERVSTDWWSLRCAEV